MSFSVPPDELGRTIAHLDAHHVEWGAPLDDTGPGGALRTLSWLDTFDGRLHRAALELVAIEGGAPAGTVELVLCGTGLATVGTSVAALPRTAEDVPPGFARDRLGITTPRALLPVLSLSARRHHGVVHGPDGSVVLDVVLVRPVDDIPVVELHAHPGHGRVARRVGEELERLGLTAAPGTALALAARRSGVNPAAHHPTRVRLDRRMPASDGVRTVLAHLARTVVDQRDGTVGEVDVEFLHDLRIAVRRTRTVLAHARRALPGEVIERAREEFAWLGSVTGPARDLDVAVAAWDRDVTSLGPEAAVALVPLRARLEARRVLAHEDLATALTSARFDDGMAAWLAWLDGPLDSADLPGGATRPLGRLVARRLERAHERLVAHGRQIDDGSPAEQLHELRKDAKRVRYLVDCFAGVIDGTAVRPLLRPLKGLLTTLGEHQDAEVRLTELAQVAASTGRRRRAAAQQRAIDELRALLDARHLAARAEVAHRVRALDAREPRRALVATVDRLRR